jgi:hypothetical protein
MKVNFFVAGGSGHWCELNHYPAILALKKEGIDARVAVICDPIDPYKTNSAHYKVGRKNLEQVLASDKPLWVNPYEYPKVELRKRLAKLFNEESINIAIVATDPTWHYFYADLVVENGINILCDKPLIVVPNSSWDMNQAMLIEQRFQSLLDKVKKNQKQNPNYRFCTPLRRRALTPFVKIANNLSKIHSETNQGLTYMTAIINGGVHRYPVEFLKGGAHGYIDGVGSLSHSSYHYLDVIAWYLQSAPGDIATIELTLPYVSRVGDYLRKQGYQHLMHINNEDPSVVVDGVELTNSILNAELDFTIHITLFDKDRNQLGLFSYTSNHSTFTSRKTKYDPEMLDHTNDKDGGRMSQIYFDVHQGALQNWLLIKNDIVFDGNTIEITQRLHPELGNPYLKEEYTDAYDSQTVTPKDLFVSFVKKSIGLPVPDVHDEHLQLLTTQELTHRIFSASYELLAQKYAEPSKMHNIRIEL